jgi:hypothetical protein
MEFLERFVIHRDVFQDSGGDDGVEACIVVGQGGDVIELAVAQARVFVKHGVVVGREDIAAVERHARAAARANQAGVRRVMAAPIEDVACGGQVRFVEMEHAEGSREEGGFGVSAKIVVCGEGFELAFV